MLVSSSATWGTACFPGLLCRAEVSKRKGRKPWGKNSRSGSMNIKEFCVPWKSRHETRMSQLDVLLWKKLCDIHIFSEKGKIQNIQCGMLPLASEERCEQTRACSCVHGLSGEETGCLGGKVKTRLAFHSISFCTVGIILTLCFHYLAGKPLQPL